MHTFWRHTFIEHFNFIKTPFFVILFCVSSFSVFFSLHIFLVENCLRLFSVKLARQFYFSLFSLTDSEKCILCVHWNSIKYRTVFCTRLWHINYNFVSFKFSHCIERKYCCNNSKYSRILFPFDLALLLFVLDSHSRDVHEMEKFTNCYQFHWNHFGVTFVFAFLFHKFNHFFIMIISIEFQLNCVIFWRCWWKAVITRGDNLQLNVEVIATYGWLGLTSFSPSTFSSSTIWFSNFDF